MAHRFCRLLLLLAGLCLSPLSAWAAKPLVTMTLIGQGGNTLSASFNNPAGSGALTGGTTGGAGWVNASLTSGVATGGTVGVPASSQTSSAPQSLVIGLGARIAVTSTSQILGGTCTVTDPLGQPALGSAIFNPANNSFVLDNLATDADRVINCSLIVGKQATMAWNITMSPNDGVAYVFATTAGPASPNGLTSMAPTRVGPNGYTSGYTTLTKLYTDTQMGGYNGWGSYGGASGMFVGGSFVSSWSITDVVCSDSAASVSGNPTGNWSVPFTWPQANFTVASSYIQPGAQILCKMIYGKPGLSLRKTNPPQLVPGVVASYTLGVVTSATPTLMDPVLTVVDQLPPNVEYVGARPVVGGGFSDSQCAASGSLGTGLLLNCQLTRLPPVPYGGIMSFEILVRPTAAANGLSLRNVAITNPTGSGPALNPASCIGDGNPLGCAVTGTLPVGGRSLGLTLKGNQPGTYTFSGNNGWVSQALKIITAGTPVLGEAQALSASAITTLNMSSSVSGQSITAVSCTGLNGGSVSFSSTSLSLDAKATALGNAVSCSVTLGSALSLSLNKISVGGVGSFSFAGNNGWTSQTLVTTTAGTPVSGATQSLTQTGVATRITETAPAGWNLAQVSCVDQNAATSGNPASVIQPPITAGNSFELPASVVRSGAALVCMVTNSYGGYTLSGQVLLDNGSGAAAGGVAHDGVQNGSETGHAGVLVQFTDCANVVYSSAVSDGSGLFALSTSGVPPGPACLIQALPESYVNVNVKAGNTGGSYDLFTRTLRFTLVANTNYSGVLFANVPKSQLLGEGAQQLVSGQSAFYAHHYVAGTSVSVAFSSSDQPSNSADRWSSLIYGDGNCNGRLDAGESVLTGAISVQAGQQLCLLLKVNSPAGLSVGARDESTLEALEVFQPQPTSGPGLVNRLTRVDVSTIGSAQGGTLSLLKQVRRVASCPSTAADTQPFATTNQAQPGQYVEYQLVYSNNSAGPLTTIRLSDSVPAYTVYRSAACGTVPTGLLSCNLVRQPVVGGSGALQWDMTDAPASAPASGLQPGGSGSVVFCVQIQN